MSPEFREMLERLLDQYYEGFVGAIAEGRTMTSDDLTALIDSAPLSAAEAVEAGLVDALLYPDEFRGQLRLIAPNIVTDYGEPGQARPDFSNMFALFSFLSQPARTRQRGPRFCLKKR